MSRSLFVTSDTHFDHKNLFDRFPMGRRAWCNSLDEMNEHMIREWNRVVGPEDVVLHLGDFSLGTKSRIAYIRSRLNGEVWLTLGNHDHTAACMSQLFLRGDKVAKVWRLTAPGLSVVCRHRPTKFTDQDVEGLQDPVYWFGHVHTNSYWFPKPHRAFGVDIDGPTPVRVRDLEEVTLS